MTTDYDAIAEQYKQSKQQPWRAYIEAFSLLELIGDPTGLSVVDLACGEGFYSRLIRQQGAAKVRGVDLSEQMIELARRQEAERPLGVEYQVCDARELRLAEPCDLAMAAYLLNYAQDSAELLAMCQGVAGSLRPGGRFVTVNCSPDLDFSRAPSDRKYGFTTATAAAKLSPGTPITWTFYLGEEAFSIENYHLDRALHEEAFRAAGFREIRWHPPRVSAGGIAALGEEFWSAFLDHSPVALIECVK